MSSKKSVSVTCKVRTRIPTDNGNFYLYLYGNNADEKEHLAIVYDDKERDVITSRSLKEFIAAHPDESFRCDINNSCRRLTEEQEFELGINGEYSRNTELTDEKAVLIRVHSECFTGEILGSQRCDCGDQLQSAMSKMAIEGRGVILYLRQEGRGIGLYDKLRAYNLQDRGYDTVEANQMLSREPDERSYEICGPILNDLGIKRVRLLTNNPDKVRALSNMGVDITERVEMRPALINSELLPYLKAKVSKMNHMLHL